MVVDCGGTSSGNGMYGSCLRSRIEFCGATMCSATDSLEVGRGLRGRQDSGGNIWATEYICNRQKTKMDWLRRSRGRRTAAKSQSTIGARS